MWYCCSSGTLDWLLQRSGHLTQLDLSWYSSLHCYHHNDFIMLSFLVLVVALLSLIMFFLITELLTQLDLSWYLIITSIVKVIMVILDLIIFTSLGVETMVDSPQLQLSFPTIIAIIVILITIISIIPTMIISIFPGVATMVVLLLLLSHRSSPQLGLR